MIWARAMNESHFVKTREPDWIRLTQLSAKADFSPSQLSPAELREMVRLYRRTSSDLAYVRTKSTNVHLAQFLNDVVAGAYSALYRNRRPSMALAFLDALATAAQTVRRRRVAVLLSFLLFVGSGAVAFAVLKAKPESRSHFVSADMEALIRQWRDSDMEERTLDESTAMTGFYASNNPRVAIITGAVAASTFGIFTAKLMYMNGAHLGTMAAELEPAGRVGYLFIHVMPHGVPELSGLIVAGSSGFVMAWALIHPGRRTRGQAMVENGKDAIVLLATGTVLMFVAAPIEGFFSFNPSVPDWLRLVVILLGAAGWGAFWIGYGTAAPSTEPSV